jgi:hypothetical protein
MDRKEFFKKIGLGVGITMAASLGSVYANFEEDADLDSEQKEFLSEYESWLKEFQQFVHKRNENVTDTENNLRLMELSALAEKRKPMLEKYMKNEVFANYFNSITEEITSAIV